MNKQDLITHARAHLQPAAASAATATAPHRRRIPDRNQAPSGAIPAFIQKADPGRCSPRGARWSGLNRPSPITAGREWRHVLSHVDPTRRTHLFGVMSRRPIVDSTDSTRMILLLIATGKPPGQAGEAGVGKGSRWWGGCLFGAVPPGGSSPAVGQSRRTGGTRDIRGVARCCAAQAGGVGPARCILWSVAR